MEITISRLWSHDNDASLLYKRPRADYRISEYLFEFINQNILVDKKLMQTGSYDFTMFLSVFNPAEHKFFFKNPYNTEETKYAPSIRYSIKSKNVNMCCDSLLFNAQMTPNEYVQIIYNIFALYFILRYKKLTKAIFDDLKQELDYKYINSFEFPARFENQKYMFDDITIGINPVYDSEQKKWLDERTFCAKDEYLRHFRK